MLDLGTLRVGVSADTAQAESNLKNFQKDLQNTEDKIKASPESASSARKAFISELDGMMTAVKAGVGAVATGFAGMVASSTKAYADYEQNLGGVAKLFGDNASQLEAYATDAWETVGVSANDYMEQVTSFSASLISSLGGDTKQAVEYANTAMTDMADNANTFGTNIDDIQHAYQGFAKQNYTMLDNLKLGYGGTKEEMQRLIDDANKVQEANGQMADLSIDSFADVVEAIHIMQEQMGIAGTTASEANKTVSGSFNAMKASWENFLTVLGTGDETQIQTAVDNLVASIGTFMGNLVPVVKTVAEEAFKQIPQVIEDLKEQLPQPLQDIIDKVTQLSPIIVGAITAIVTAWEGAKFVEKIGEVGSTLAKFVTTNPALAIIAAITAIVAGLVTLYETNDDFRNSVDTLVSDIQSALSPIIQKAQEIIPEIIQKVQECGQALSDMGSNIADFFIPILQSLLDGLAQIGTALQPIIDLVIQIVSQLAQMFGEEFINFISSLQQDVLPIIQEIGSALMDFATTVAPLIQGFLTIVISGIADVVSTIVDFLQPAVQTISDVWNAVFPAIQQVTESAFNIISTVITTAMGVIEQVIELATNIIQGNWSGAWQNVQNIVGIVWEGIKSIVSNAINAVKAVIQGALDTIKAIWNNAWNGLKSIVTTAFDGIKSGVSNGINLVLSYVRNLPGNIKNSLGNLGNLLVNAGKSIMDGLLNGIKNGVGAVYDFVSGIGDRIAQLKGPIPYDLKLLIPNGKAIMKSLSTGIIKGFPVVEDAIKDITQQIADADYGTLKVSAGYEAYRASLPALDTSSVPFGNTSTSNITVNNYSPKALNEAESARQFRRTAREYSFMVA